MERGVNASPARHPINEAAQERAEEAPAADSQSLIQNQSLIQSLIQSQNPGTFTPAEFEKFQRATSGRTPYGLFEQERKSQER